MCDNTIVFNKSFFSLVYISFFPFPFLSLFSSFLFFIYLMMAVDTIKEIDSIKQSSNNNLLYETDQRIQLPPTPTSSDDEQEHPPAKDPVRLARRQTLADLIPAASAALRERSRLNNEPTQNSPLARALTKVKIGVQTHRIKERFLTNEWIRLALSTPLDDSTINSTHRVLNKSRTKEIVAWYEWKNKRVKLSIDELEKKVDALRRKKLVQQQLPPSPPHSRIVF